MKSEKCVIVTCCECGMPFRAMGEGQFVTCPYCGAELSLEPIRNNGISIRNVCVRYQVRDIIYGPSNMLNFCIDHKDVPFVID